MCEPGFVVDEEEHAPSYKRHTLLFQTSKKPEEMEVEKATRGHVLVLPYTTQGHINPMLQFSRRLTHKGLRVTLVTTIQNLKDMRKANPSDPDFVSIELISDGFDDGLPSEFTVDAYLATLERVGSLTLDSLLARLSVEGSRPLCIIYDSFLPWVLDVAHAHGILGATYHTQSCAVNTIYRHLHGKFSGKETKLELPLSLPGMPLLDSLDLPSLIAQPEAYPAYLKLVMEQFRNMDKADFVLENSFESLEGEFSRELAKGLPIKMIGPAVPSAYLDNRIPDDKGPTAHLCKAVDCLNWLDERPFRSTVYAAFGSLVSMAVEQMEEIAWGLHASKRPFVWVVKPPPIYLEGGNLLPKGFSEATIDQGIVVPWCPQLEVLSHTATACFLTHCGWNSTLEGLSLGVPMVAVPQWTDQPTDAKFVSDVWQVGIRAKADDRGIVCRDEVAKCLRDVLDDDRAAQIRRNAERWRELAKEALDEGGSSDRNIDEFVAAVLENKDSGRDSLGVGGPNQA
ncbi:UDP-glycosyltransferase 74E2 [Amborella trichopoda]|uniref:Glycosyltransferase n=1 Tax=Amborella trichopoda TaxID=13333 RepID=U5DI88_AMBTC|nr:UDP-glycosyltransferase 74E2 [Amborella trichopoda]ERN20293.1 hypothetical protein AMTR_s00066p00176700 [Amborella trichopoda]|eukprot:XP_006858826.1 UDP-glycosyltransferase 74E2 [Amborella trichopoda]